jgi:hypothetical protein
VDSFVALLVALAMQEPAPDAWPQVEVRSPNGRRVARIAKAGGQERVADALARWQVSVSSTQHEGTPEGAPDMWSGPYPHRPGQHYLLSDDGLLLVQVSAAYSASHTMVRIHREGRELADLAGADLDLEQRALPKEAGGERAWLAAGAEPTLAWSTTGDGPELRLGLSCSDGRTRTVNALTGRLVREQPAEALLQIDPAVVAEAQAACELPYVRAVRAPRFVPAGTPVTLEVEGDFPTPGWRLLGFRLDATAELVILALRLENPAAQVLKSYSSKVAVHGLAPGSHTLFVRGREGEPGQAVAIEVLPSRLRLSLAISGGFVGLRETFELFEAGVLRVQSRFFEGERFGLARWAAMELDALVAALPATDSERLTPGAADMLHMRLSYWREGSWVTLVVDDGTAAGATAALIERVRAMAAPLL